VTEPIRLAVEIECPPAHAFDVWTTKTSMWWPVEHTVSQVRGLQVVFEPRSGGRIFERTPSGGEIPWGEITAWEPPRRLVYRWYIMTEPRNATEVELRFLDRGDGNTRLEIEHRGWDALGDFGTPGRGENNAGWAAVLTIYVGACTQLSPNRP